MATHFSLSSCSSEQLAHELRRATTTIANTADRPETVKEGKPAEALAAASRVCAVSADVAMRLHTNNAALPLPDVGCDGISAAPSRLRADFGASHPVQRQSGRCR